jgi:hypothetical protein
VYANGSRSRVPAVTSVPISKSVRYQLLVMAGMVSLCGMANRGLENSHTFILHNDPDIRVVVKKHLSTPPTYHQDLGSALSIHAHIMMMMDFN